jgi:hypothetical protein
MQKTFDVPARRWLHLQFRPPRPTLTPLERKQRVTMNEEAGPGPKPRRIEMFGRGFNLPQGRWQRIALGAALVFFGILGFLPVLGFWMIPLGLFVLSLELPAVRRWRRRLIVRFSKRKGKAG